MVLDLVLDPTTVSLAFVLLVVFLILYATFAGFSMVGITPGEVVVVLFLAPFLAPLSLPLFSMDGILLGVNVAGALIPVGLSLRFLIKDRMPLWKAIVGIAVVTGVAYWVAVIDPERGILVPSLPIVVASLFIGLSLARANWDQVGPITYASGAMGTLIGADLLNLQAVVAALAQADRDTAAVIGGAGTLDAIYLVALVAVIGAIGAVATARFLGVLSRA